MSNLRKVFHSMDKQNTGYLRAQEVEEGLKALNISDAEIKEMFKSLMHGSDEGKINYSTFLAATIDRKKTLTL
jgi:Ca2+-binding EF-hand superfamily protein